METRTCHFCGHTVPKEAFCSDCTEQFVNRPAPEALTPDEREAEMRSFDGPVEVPFDLMHRRMESLVGRPVWTHEMGLNWEGLCREARWESRPATIEEIIDIVPQVKRVVVDLQDI